MKNRWSVYAVAAGIATLALLAGSLPTSAGISVLQPPQSCDDPTSNISLFARTMGKGKIGYGLTPETVSVPGPTIQMTEGDCLAIDLVNDTDRPLSFHPHGVDYSVQSDGTPHNSSCVPPHRSRTYVVAAHAPAARPDGTIDQGSAGYWHYHDHCMGTPHGTAGVARGLFGALIVRRPGDPQPSRDPYVLVMQGTTFNQRRAPKTPILKANLGERVEFVVIGHGELFHTFHLHGHRWSETRTGMPSSLSDSAITIDNKTVGPADSFGFQVVAGEHVGEGAWMYHCHVQSHSDIGMNGLFVVRGADGTMNAQTKRAIKKWRRQEGHHG